MMTFTTIIPKRRNNGKPIKVAELNDIMQSLAEQFGGATLEGETQGIWIDEEARRTYKDTGIRVTVACKREQIGQAETAVIEIGRRLRQKAMYFEVRYFDGVRILKVD
jgi:hypothetical protein